MDDKEAYAALSEWKNGKSYTGYADDHHPGNVDYGFIAGYEAGITAMRDAVLKLWDENDGWIAGADYHRLAAVLGIEPDRVKSYRQGGQSKPSQRMRSRNIPLG